MATKTEKTVNYTDEQASAMATQYAANPSKETVEALATAMGKTARSVVAKLSRMGVYKKAEYVGKTGEKPVKKDEHADKLGELVGLTEGEADSLTKANKTALAKIIAHVESLKAQLAEADTHVQELQAEIDGVREDSTGV